MEKKLVTFRLCLGLFLCLFAYAAFGQKSKVPISFEKYHGYTGSVEYMKAVNKAYPNITELLEIGKSAQNRPIYVLVITNKNTGTTMDREKRLEHERKLEVPNPPFLTKDLGKSGHLITGATHGNEQTGTEVALYFIDKMVSGYGSDTGITELIDTKVFYVSPANNPDGLYNTVELGAPQRSNSMLQDESTEKPPRKDLNGDGLFSQVRYKDPKGLYKKDSVDNRIMVRIGTSENVPENERYSIIAEAEPDKGIDINRNFPEVWWTKAGFPGGTGEYPTQAPEVHAMCEFIIEHPNIIMVNEYHTQGGHVYRPMGASSHKEMRSRDVVIYDLIMGKKYLELMSVTIPEAWKNPERLDYYKRIHKDSTNIYSELRGYNLPFEWRVPYDEQRDDSRYYGLMLDWLYKQNGMYSIVTELWNPSYEIEELKGLRGIKLQREELAYLDKTAPNKVHLDWKPAKHPKHGDVEVGGWIGSIGRNNAYPGKVLEAICERQWQFDRFRSELMPQMQINDITVKKQSAGNTVVLEITAEVENVGALPTTLEGATSVAMNRGDVVWLIGENNKITYLSGRPNEKIGTLFGSMRIPGYRGDSRKKLTWVVSVEKGEKVKIAATSLKGGTVVKEVKY